MYKIVGSEEDVGCDYRMRQRQASKGTGILGERKGKERGKMLTYIYIQVLLTYIYSASRKGE